MRFEIKVPIEKFNDLKFLEWFCNTKLRKVFPNREVNSVYYDTNNLICAKDNLSGISERRKYRVRWYNSNLNNRFYEIKIKKNQLGSKIISSVDSEESSFDNLFSLNSISKNTNKSLLLKNIYHLNLIPKIRISYTRSYFAYDNVRITYDNNIHYYLLNLPGKKSKFANDNLNILEFKFDEKDYGSALNVIKISKFLPRRFSKYLRGLYLHKKANYI